MSIKNTWPQSVKIHPFLNDLVLDQLDKADRSNFRIDEKTITANIRMNIFETSLGWFLKYFNDFYRFEGFRFLRNLKITEMNLYNAGDEEIVTGSDFCLVFRESNKVYSVLYQAKMIEVNTKKKKATIILGDKKSRKALNTFKVDPDANILQKTGISALAVTTAPGTTPPATKVKQYEIQKEFSRVANVPALHIFYSRADIRAVEFAAFFSLTDTFAAEWDKLNVTTSKIFNSDDDLSKILFNMKETTLSKFLNEYGFGDLSKIRLQDIKLYYDHLIKGLSRGVTPSAEGGIREMTITERPGMFDHSEFQYFSFDTQLFYKFDFFDKKEQDNTYLPSRIILIDLNNPQ